MIDIDIDNAVYRQTSLTQVERKLESVREIRHCNRCAVSEARVIINTALSTYNRSRSRRALNKKERIVVHYQW